MSEKRPKLFKTIVVAVTGSTGAASAIPRFLVLLRQLFADEVVVVLSKAAQHFISPYVATIFSGTPAIAEFYSCDKLLVPHVQATEAVDIVIVMPATANILGKVANGIADELVSATILAAKAPVVFVPNMNESMWTKPAVQANVAKLKDYGYYVVPPTWGTEMASLEPTFGAMPTFPEIIKTIASVVGITIPLPTPTE